MEKPQSLLQFLLQALREWRKEHRDWNAYLNSELLARSIHLPPPPPPPPPPALVGHVGYFAHNLAVQGWADFRKNYNKSREDRGRIPMPEELYEGGLRLINNGLRGTHGYALLRTAEDLLGRNRVEQTRIRSLIKELDAALKEDEEEAPAAGLGELAVSGDVMPAPPEESKEDSVNPYRNSESNVVHPSHYNQGKIEVIDFIADQKLNFELGSAVKYICRAPYKGKPVEDLQKALAYLQFELKKGDTSGSK